MVKRGKWIERKFEFNLPAGVFPNLLVRMLGAPARLEDMTKSSPDSILSYKPDGKWSVKEHIGHLIDLESLHEKRLVEILAGVEILSAADMSNKKTIAANHNAKNINDLLAEFRKVRTDFVERLETLDDDTVVKYGHHPRLNQPMRIIDIAYFTSEHDDHHITTMREIIKQQV